MKRRSNTYIFWRAVVHTAILFAVAWPIAFLLGLWLDVTFN
jgi:hypothetical protein